MYVAHRIHVRAHHPLRSGEGKNVPFPGNACTAPSAAKRSPLGLLQVLNFQPGAGKREETPRVTVTRGVDCPRDKRAIGARFCRGEDTIGGSVGDGDRSGDVDTRAFIGRDLRCCMCRARSPWPWFKGTRIHS